VLNITMGKKKQFEFVLHKAKTWRHVRSIDVVLDKVVEQLVNWLTKRAIQMLHPRETRQNAFVRDTFRTNHCATSLMGF
jgi:hypothetical protein